jgi:hypothetical protein
MVDRKHILSISSVSLIVNSENSTILSLLKLSLATLDNRTAADKEFTKPRVVSGNVDGITYA